VLRGGSFLCSDVYCMRYRAGGRQQGEPKTGQSHTGFRCVKSAGGKK
jgi:sulfatase modifying factor 1